MNSRLTLAFAAAIALSIPIVGLSTKSCRRLILCPYTCCKKCNKVMVKFYNVDDVQTERHSFTIGDPYKVNIDVGFSENGNATFTADNAGVFPFYCKYHLPVMMGQLVVLP